jgi:hypothetical protein
MNNIHESLVILDAMIMGELRALELAILPVAANVRIDADTASQAITDNYIKNHMGWSADPHMRHIPDIATKLDTLIKLRERVTVYGYNRQ